MIGKDDLIPDVVGRHPATREVFDRYGLKGCGGAEGPRETLEFFSRVHAVPLDRLLRELEEAKDRPAERTYVEDPGDLLYRKFFSAAILFLLGLGALAGLVILSVPWTGQVVDPFLLTQLHVNAQVFGWIGLFVMGFATQGLPRFKYVRLRGAGAAQASLAMMAAGVVLHLGFLVPGGIWAAFAGGILEAAAALVFAAVMFRTLRGAGPWEAWERTVHAGLVLFVLAALLDPLLVAACFLAPSPLAPDLLGPYRHLQLFGFGGLVTFGVAQRILPTAFGFRTASPRVSAICLVLLAGGLAAWVGGETAWLRTRIDGFRTLSQAGAVAFAAGVALLAAALGALRSGDPGRTTKFLRSAWAWALVAAAMIALEPLFLSFAGEGWSAAYRRGAYHAFALGFLSQMIVGVSIKVVPVLRGFDLEGLPRLRAVWLLLNGGTLLRVTGAALPHSAAMAALGGAFAFAALAGWALHLWPLLHRKEAPAKRPPPGVIAAESIVADVVDAHPETLAVFEAHGFAPLRNPLLRATLGRRVTVRTACSMKGVDLPAFLHALSEATRAPARFQV